MNLIETCTFGVLKRCDAWPVFVLSVECYVGKTAMYSVILNGMMFVMPN